MDMRTDFEFKIDDKTFSTKVETWQEAVEFFLESANEAGFTVDELRRKAIVEIARTGKVTL